MLVGQRVRNPEGPVKLFVGHLFLPHSKRRAAAVAGDQERKDIYVTTPPITLNSSTLPMHKFPRPPLTQNETHPMSVNWHVRVLRSSCIVSPVNRRRCRCGIQRHAPNSNCSKKNSSLKKVKNHAT